MRNDPGKPLVPFGPARRESNRQKSKIRTRIEHVFGFMSQLMKGFYLRSIGRRRNAAAIGLINLIFTTWPAPNRSCG